MVALKQCPHCGLDNFPYLPLCEYCARSVQTAQDAHDQRQRWSEAPRKLRRDCEEAITLQRNRVKNWLAHLERKRTMHILFGAGLFLGTSTFPTFFVFLGGSGQFFLMAVFDLLVGAGLGWGINRIRSGPWRGSACFALAYLSIFFLKLSTGWIGMGIPGLLILAFGFLLALSLGCLFGLSLTLERSDA